MKRFLGLAAIITALTLSGCVETTGNKQLIGAGSGAVLGGLAGSQIGDGKGQLIATGIGAVAGLLVGSEVGKSLDKADIAYANQAQSQAYNAPVGQTVNWNNPESGNYGSFTPVRDGRLNDGRYCREFKQSIVVDGRTETAYGTACQNPNGTWQIINS